MKKILIIQKAECLLINYIKIINVSVLHKHFMNFSFLSFHHSLACLINIKLMFPLLFWSSPRKAHIQLIKNVNFQIKDIYTRDGKAFNP